MYKHTQTGGIMILSALGALAIGVFAGSVTPHFAGFYPAAAVALFIYLGFRDLTVEVDHEAVRLTFGVGFIKKEFKLRDIVSVRAARNSW
ncbi:MAG: hypothetical protein Q7R35_00790, partial [Elusimicrobiota bacterium]|nr:hypothetical protein [Elusimicrobiota bacterium]